MVVTIALLFGLVMGFNFLTSGIEETTIAASAGQTGGEVYMEASYGKMRGGGYDDETYIHSAEELAEVSLAPVLDEEADEKVRERAAELRDQLHYIEVTVEKQKIISNDNIFDIV